VNDKTLNKKPFFSIIIPVYNSGKTIEDCLNSITIQCFNSLEVIIIDAESNDNTRQIVERFKTNLDINLRSEKDNGIYDAMNKGISKAKGQWFFFLGSDDKFFNENVLQDISQMINTRPKCKFIYGDVYTSGNYFQKYENYNYHKLLDVNICHQTIFYHHSLFNDLRYDLKYKLSADWDFNLKIFKKRNDPCYINKPLSIFNLNGTSNNWIDHPEVLKYFSNKKLMIFRYKGGFYYIAYYLVNKLKRIIQSK
jgi:glycosyltransferase involved in cell wall biosynthesis